MYHQNIDRATPPGVSEACFWMPALTSSLGLIVGDRFRHQQVKALEAQELQARRCGREKLHAARGRALARASACGRSPSPDARRPAESPGAHLEPSAAGARGGGAARRGGAAGPSPPEERTAGARRGARRVGRARPAAAGESGCGERQEGAPKEGEEAERGSARCQEYNSARRRFSRRRRRRRRGWCRRRRPSVCPARRPGGRAARAEGGSGGAGGRPPGSSGRRRGGEARSGAGASERGEESERRRRRPLLEDSPAPRRARGEPWKERGARAPRWVPSGRASGANPLRGGLGGAGRRRHGALVPARAPPRRPAPPRQELRVG